MKEKIIYSSILSVIVFFLMVVANGSLDISKWGSDMAGVTAIMMFTVFVLTFFIYSPIGKVGTSEKSTNGFTKKDRQVTVKKIINTVQQLDPTRQKIEQAYGKMTITDEFKIYCETAKISNYPDYKKTIVYVKGLDATELLLSLRDRFTAQKLVDIIRKMEQIINGDDTRII